jgi:hypothetical protein
MLECDTTPYGGIARLVRCDECIEVCWSEAAACVS